MKGAARPRVRPNKVIKPSAPARRANRLVGGDGGVDDEGAGKPEPGQPSLEEDGGGVDDQQQASVATAAAAVAAAAGAAEIAPPDEEMGDDEMNGDANAESSADLHADSYAPVHALGGDDAPSVNENRAQVSLLQQDSSMGEASVHQQLAAQGNQGHDVDPALVRATEEVAHEIAQASLPVESALAKRLAREPAMRLAQQRRPEQQLNLNRRSNVEALFAHISGAQAPVQCKNCHKGHGPWTSCVVVDGQMCGSCANCWFNASGARCSFHETRTPQRPALGAPHRPSVHSEERTFGIQQPVQLPPVTLPPGSSLGSLGLSSLIPHNEDLRWHVESAIATVRASAVSKKARQLIAIEVAAKQLALQILEYEETLAQEQALQHMAGDESHDGNP